MIKISKIAEEIFEVTVSKESVTNHRVKLSSKVYKDLSDGEISEIDLIKRSFEFLLKRESNQSILREFDLEVIENYFPEYPSIFKNI